MARTIRVVPHNSQWLVLYKREAARISLVLGDQVVGIHHIGSTAIKGISAKPIIDVLVEVHDIATVDEFSEEMLALGYRPRGEQGIPGRRYFVRGEDDARKAHVHVFQTGNPEVERHLNFRDYMNTHPQDAQAYGRLKEELAREFSTDIGGYTEGKNEFIKEMDKRAAAWRQSSN